jgi:hypothetical protein
MKDKLKKTFSDRWIYITILINMAVGVLNGLLHSPFYLHFLNGITIIGMLTLFVGIAKWFWKEGDFAYFAWRAKKGSSYTSYHDEVVKQRKDKTNPCLYAGAFVAILATILSLLY